MKKKLSFCALVGLSLLSVFTRSAFAQSLAATETSEDPVVTSETETEAAKSARMVRIEANKKKITVALSAAARVRIAERCVAAQARVKSHQAANKTADTVRAKAYESIVGTLQKVADAQSAKGVDVATLTANITELQAKIASYQLNETAFLEALDDLYRLDCKADPAAFKASLEVARTAQAAVLLSAKDIRAYLNDTVKVTLNNLKENAQTNEEQ